MASIKAGKPCARMVPTGATFDEYHDCEGEGCCPPMYRVCGAPTIIRTWNEGTPGDPTRVTETECSVCDAEPVEVVELCECGAPAAYDGLCYECQTVHHSMGDYDMDGEGWR